MNSKERLDLAEWAMSHALKSGADEAAIAFFNQREIQIEFRDKRLEQLKESVQNRLGLEVYVDQRYSGHSTNDIRKDSLSDFIAEAVASTKYLTKDEYRSLPDPKYYPEELDVDLKIYDPAHAGLESSDRVKLAAQIEAEAMAQSDRIISTTSWYEDSSSESIRIHSNGFLGQTRGTSFGAGAEVTVRGEEDDRPDDWFWAQTRFYEDLPTPEMMGKRAVARALGKIGQKKIDSGKYDMIVENRSGRRLLSMFNQPMSGRALQQKSSFLEGMIGKPIASEKMTVADDPFLEKGLGSRLFDGEGLAAKRRIIIEKGILRYYFIDNYYGKKLGMEPTTGYPANIIFEHGTMSSEQMVKGMKKGILVNGFIGGNSNPTTGDFSFGITGLLIENGEIVKPVNEMNISGNAKEFWNRLVEVGNDPYPYSPWRVPSMFFESVQFSGI